MPDAATWAKQCQNLWCAVLLQALKDATYPTNYEGVGWIDKQAKAELKQRRAKAWLGSRDFRAVCDYAGFDPKHVIRKTMSEEFTKDLMKFYAVSQRLGSRGHNGN
jgi:hypothetical protein